MAAEHSITSTDRLDEEVKRRFSYDPVTGALTRKGAAGKGKAGYFRMDGYIDIDIKVDGVNHRTKAHRVAWFLATGSWPTGVIDHINGNRSDNSLANLRDVSHKINMHNISTEDVEAGRFVGVRLQPNGRYRAEIEEDDRRIDLGCWTTSAEAIAAYRTAKWLLHAGYMGR